LYLHSLLVWQTQLRQVKHQAEDLPSELENVTVVEYLEIISFKVQGPSKPHACSHSFLLHFAVSFKMSMIKSTDKAFIRPMQYATLEAF